MINWVSIDIASNVFLAGVLRKQLGLIGTRIGCPEAERGICVGRAIKASDRAVGP